VHRRHRDELQAAASVGASNEAFEDGKSIIHSFPYLGVGLIAATEQLGAYLKYKGDGGVFVRKVAPRGVCADAGMKDGDMLLEFDGYPLDRFGETTATKTHSSLLASERMNVFDLAERIPIGKKVDFKIWRDGKPGELSATFAHQSHHVYPIDSIDEPVLQQVGYVIVGGVVLMDLSLNHLDFLLESNPSLVDFYKGDRRTAPKVVISTILPESSVPDGSLNAGDIIATVDGEKVNTLADVLRIVQSAKTSNKSQYLAITTTENSMVVLPKEGIEIRHGMARSGSSAIGQP